MTAVGGLGAECGGFRFDLSRICDRSGARLGKVRTPHGSFETPAFMPVGTQGSVKGISPHELEETGSGVMLCNTYHLALRPGQRLIRELDGLHRFTGWHRPILTDSGGFQVFSQRTGTKVSEEGVWFTSHIDGARNLMTPESSVRIQNDLGADIIMAFDECVPYPCERGYVEKSVAMTERWAARSLGAHARRGEQAIFGIVQGGMHADLRERSLRGLTAMPFDGYALGGLSVGEPKAEMLGVLGHIGPMMPAMVPRYLMGVGSPD
ncbi:MAG: tRNA guanosine(34) transglycosylase Tgt, partial [Oscillospiraceae bacterium]|nr:tRNA guanosine(34) transglycosylase Tgt [Oscillospiraceae bacterium]